MANININGENITGRSITINNNRVIIDGVDHTPDSKIITITVTGDVDKIDASSGDVTVNGNSGGISTMSGDVDVTGNVDGSVKTMSGDVDCSGSISGNVSTLSGDIKSRKA